MKKILLISLLLIFSYIDKASAQYSRYEPASSSRSSLSNIPDGWYSSIVIYNNPATYTRSKYVLDVKVSFGRVVVIKFENGGSLHTGMNNEGYTYIGGDLSIKKDYNGNITEISTRVSIVDKDITPKTFDIYLQ